MVIYTKYTYYIISTIVNIEICINNIAHYTFIPVSYTHLTLPTKA